MPEVQFGPAVLDQTLGRTTASADKGSGVPNLLSPLTSTVRAAPSMVAPSSCRDDSGRYVAALLPS
jgi:hypothetical protein